MTEVDQSILNDVDMYHDGNDTSNEDEYVSNSDNEKSSCNFENSEGEAHIYNSSQISTNTFTKADFMSIHLSQLMLQHRIARAAYRDKPGAKISHSKTVDVFLKSKSRVKGHEYDVCPSGCQLYGINDDQESCVDCDKL
ncbi:hypothetical protein PHYBLDRAFT_143922 [Phycomyces blakesleeanus NRRL 1555(-)]|uniref:Uncharacterized protein n=1 Tax=Phycomyces blakesleeanus (strain ATCC 8743b / DSM 1359 / FGSC 10004 / NBRC 33097 / NRRL 1555) TaxID=763407 RepID=A0A167NCM7_PHYB8|nr:hypothetical protein PHYBLDRAFT_143922 [Phycomyces blakesleeanus NRRL 1555(-)]OAD75674.1 hypothetical protein PHYBLDRAFT_143922 [Phycomyces blakesleeanus NRRL 1555(-)]|eukprot:XP_018293714.1 hypothetical protein PHYBLDRAFT_143922 [Phycomyces blakesleeanus NRRL 1555(-)]